MREDEIEIEGGEVFTGSWAMLADCFGVSDIETLYAFCAHEKWEFAIRERKELTVRWSDCDWQPAGVQ